MTQVLSRYEVLREVGRGGMGVVYEAFDTRLERRVAMKALLRDDHEPDHRRRFRQEARAASALNHPNIVTVHDIDADGAVDYIVMEYIDGVSLDTVIREGPLPIDRAAGIAAQIAGALAAAHAAGIVHRDLKPSNVMITPAGTVKVVDFGLSKLAAAAPFPAAETTRSAPPVSSPGLIVGTGGYMSPEQASGAPVDARTDVFAFGIVLYEMLTGQRAFAGDSYWSTLRAVLDAEVVPVERFRPDTPPALRRILDRCLRRDAGDRYASGSELLAELAPLAARPRLTLRAAVAAHPRACVAVAAALLAGAGAVAVPAVRWYSERSLQSSLRHIEALVDTGAYASAFTLAQGLRVRAPGDSRVQRAYLDVSVAMDVRTEPEGAEIFYRQYGDDTARWERLGTSPIEGGRIPFGAVHWRVQKPGFDPAEGRFLWWNEPIRLQPAGSSPDGMVFVPKGPVQARLSGAFVGDFWIDKYEVTNRAYKTFVDAGGYADRRFWTEPFARDGHTLSWDAALALLRDKTGRPGPATWELGTYPAGEADRPVGGVSWYEAAAYAAFAGTHLPTVAHWLRASGPPNLRDDIPLGNFASQRALPVTALKDLGPSGTYGLAGNVKEWCVNPIEGQRYILGGAWNEPIYMGTNFDARPPFDRSETNGFRTARYVDPPGDTNLAEVRALPRHVELPPPVSDAVFEAFRSFYAYDRTPLDAKVERVEEAEHWRKETISIATAYGHDRMLIHLLLPKNAAPPYQAVLYYPGGYAYTLGSSAELPVPIYFDFIPRSGRALVHPVYQATYERRWPGGPPAGRARRDMMIDTAKDVSRTIDYLETRSDIDRDRIGFYVFSTGIQVLPALAFEPRIKTTVFLSAGFGPRARIDRLPEIDPVNFAPRIHMPLLLLGGRYDFVLPLETAQKPLFERFGTAEPDKRHFIFDSGHVPPRITMIRETLDWLDRWLGPVVVR
jgi:predicted Ser/Thr protein kinase